MGTRAWAVASVLAAGLLSGCSDDDSTFRRDGESRAEFAHRVVNDENATPAEIAEAGERAQSGEFAGRDLVVYRLIDPADGGETPAQFAWRLLDVDGDLVAEARARYGMHLRVLPDGFLIRSASGPRLVHIGRTGGARTVAIGRTRPTRPGDVLVAQNSARSIAYRPGSGGTPGSAAFVPRARLRTEHSLVPEDALTVDGTLWVRQIEDPPQRAPAAVLWSTDGRAPWHTTRLPVPAASFALGPLTALGDRVYTFTARGWIGGGERLESLWSTRRGEGWTRIPLTGIPRRRGDADPQVARTEDGTLQVVVERVRYVRDGNRFVPVGDD